MTERSGGDQDDVDIDQAEDDDMLATGIFLQPGEFHFDGCKDKDEDGDDPNDDQLIASSFCLRESSFFIYQPFSSPPPLNKGGEGGFLR